MDLASLSALSTPPRPAPPVPEPLPIEPFLGKIASLLRKHDSIIITAETGSGKTTRVPAYLREAGFGRIIVSEPRRLAASAVAGWVAGQMGEELGKGRVGFRHAMEQLDGPNTGIVYCTDGYQVVRELSGSAGRRDVLIIDEVHEWNQHMELLLAHAQYQRKHGVDFKLVIMSATLDAERLSKYLDGAPIVQVPGRVFPIEERKPRATEIGDILSGAREGKGVLVFEPGKTEIKETIQKLGYYSDLNAEILPLHGQLTKAEQRRAAVDKYERPKIIVSTNIAQTSLTIEDVQMVVDSGLERRIEIRNGIECLDYCPISQAAAIQRKGRAGRTGPGIYIYRGSVPFQDLPPFQPPEINRTLLDQMVLRVARHGLDMRELEFFHQPSEENIRYASETLRALGLLTPGGQITSLGCEVADMPVGVRGGVMIAKARALENEFPGITREMIAIAALFESEGIVSSKVDWKKMPWAESDKLKHCYELSDLFVQLKAFRAAQNMHGSTFAGQHAERIEPPSADGPNGEPESEELITRGAKLSERFLDNGIKEHNFYGACAMERLLQTRLKLPKSTAPTEISPEMYQALRECICYGMLDNVFRRVKDGWKGMGDVRVLSKRSAVGDANLIVGRPLDLTVPDEDGELKVLPLVLMGTQLDPKFFEKHATEEVQADVGRVVQASKKQHSAGNGPKGR